MTTDKRETMHDAARRLGVTVEITHDRGLQVEDGWEHHAYVLAVHFGADGALTVPWKQGVGIEESPEDEAATILDALVSDSTEEDFEDWCGDYGLDTDSRKAWKAWKACRETHDDLTRLLGADALHTLVYDTDRL